MFISSKSSFGGSGMLYNPMVLAVVYNCPNQPPNSDGGVGEANDTFITTSLVVPPGGHPNSSVIILL